MLLSSQSLSCVPKGAASPLGIERPWCAPLLQHLALSVMYSAFVGDLSLTPEDVSHGWLIFAFLIGFSKNFYDRKNCICTYVCIHTHTHIYRERAFTIIYHSSTLAWRIPWMEEPGGLQSLGSLRVGHDWVTSLSLFTFLHWMRKWQPTPVFLPGESQGWLPSMGSHRVGHDRSNLAAAVGCTGVYRLT